jgi:hypothetical protein
MTIQQTVTIPADRRLHLDLPLPGTFSPDDSPRLLTQSEFDVGLPCPMDHTPNAETIAAMQEARDILSGKIQAKRYSSLAEFNAEIAAEIAAEDAIVEEC